MKMKIEVNGLTRPVIDSTPKISLIYPSDEFSAQKSARIVVCFGGYPVFSKDVDSDERACLPLEFDMAPCTEYEIFAVSETLSGKIYEARTSFSTGKLGSPWAGRWITADYAVRRDEVLYAVYLRREFSCDKPKKATLYVSGLGLFEARINGEKVGDDFLSTPYTAYDKHINYRVFDVTEMILSGENAIGVILGNGFYNCFTVDPWQTATAPWRDVPKMICELHLEYEDGVKIIKSDRTWQSVKGPITFNGIRHGEEYDARLEQDGWDKAGFLGETFAVRTPKAPGAIMSVTEVEPIRVREKFVPVSRRKVKKGWLYELEIDTAGICNITFYGKAGTKIKIQYGDHLNEKGELDNTLINSFVKNYTFQTDVYIKKSDLPETWHPIFVYHGFKYIEISGCKQFPECGDVEAWALCNDFIQKSGFSSGDELVNTIQKMCLRSTTACCVGTLSSDTVREKTSWTGDVGFSVEQLLINFKAERLMKKWQTDLLDGMRPEGGFPCIVPSAGWGYNSINGPDWTHPVFEVPLRLYMMTGDVSYINDNIDAICRHCDYVESMAEDDGTVCYGLGDWCAPFEGEAISVNMESFKCPVVVSDMAFRYSALNTLLYFADVVGRKDITEKYAPKAENVKRIFREKLFDKSTFTVKGDCQSATGIMVYYGLCEPDEIAPLGEKLCEQIKRDGGKLDFGVLGVKAVLDTLARTGHTDVALDLLKNPEYPSVKHWIDMGATVMWECWNGKGSHNQHMFTCISAFLYKHVAGISCGAPAWKKIVFTPGIASGVPHAEAYVDTPWGRAECAWKIEGDNAVIDLTVPSSCTGVIELPCGSRTLDAGEYTIELSLADLK
ncbi:MAG: family 78 glycoside hydrolase catalytic domain [Clostridia bacterium]|nr:family 78 glycoside hydrolase catalytic domain [Clostridia bacterium]